ncbi:MAG: hypothetical protein QOF31_938 [Mycobacterium sp.]|nr:hypothetical protein [Mycobacterium sp.]
MAGGILDQMDLAHPSGTEPSQDPVSGEGLPNLQRHGEMLAVASATLACSGDVMRSVYGLV